MAGGGYGGGPWGGGAWGGAGGGGAAVEHIPTTPTWDIFDLGGVQRSDIDRLPDFIEVNVVGSPGAHFVGSWNLVSGGAFPDTIAYLRFDVPVTETFTVEYNVKFNDLPEDFSDPENLHLYLGAWSAQDFASGFLFSKAGVAYTGEVSISPGGDLTYAQSIDVIPGSSDWFPNVFAIGEDITIRIVIDSEIPVLYLFITKTAELEATGHVLRALLLPKETQPNAVDEVIVSVRGTALDEVQLELINDYRMSSKALIPNLAPVAIAGDDQAVRLCSIVQLDGTQSFDPEGEDLLYEWRLIDAPIDSMFLFASNDGRTEPDAIPSGFTKVFYSNALGVEHAREPVQVNDVITFDGLGYTIKAVNDVVPFNVEVEYSQLPDSLVNIRYKLLRQTALKDTDQAKPTFFPDVPGFWVLDLRVNDGVLWSSPLGLERSRVLIDVRESPLPRSCTTPATFVFNSLLDFWKLVEDADRISTLWEGMIQVVATELLTLWQAEYSKSLRDVQRQVIRRWLHYDLMIPEPVPELTEIKFLWGGVLSQRFQTASVVGTSLFVTTPLITEPIEIRLSSPGAITAAQYAKELQTRLRDQVNSEFSVEALESDVLLGGNNGVILEFGLPPDNVVFTTDPTWNLFEIGVQVGDELNILDGDDAGTFTITNILGIDQLEVSVPFVGGLQEGVGFIITRPGVTFQQVRIDGPFYFTITSDSTAPFFSYPAVNNVPTGMSGLKINDRVFKVDRPVGDLGFSEDDLLVIGTEAYRIVEVLTSAEDEYEGQRVVVKENLPELEGFQEWVIPGWVSSEFLNFYQGLFFRGDVVEFEVAQETEELLQTVQVRDLVTTTAFAANAERIDRLAIDTATLWSKLPIDDALRLVRIVRRRYCPIDSDIVDVPTLQELIEVEDDEGMLRRNVDYFVEEFRGRNSLRFQSGLDGDDGDIWEAARPPDRLWAEYTYVDNEPVIEGNFGVAIDVTRGQVPDNVDYLGAVRGLWYALYNGPTVRNIRIANQILLGLPFAEVAGTIVEIRDEFLSQRARLLLQDVDNPEIVRSYVYPRILDLETNPETGEQYKLGDSVDEFAPLVTGAEVVDYVKDPTWFEGILNQGIFWEVQKYHTFVVRVDFDAFNLDALLEAKTFTRKIKPVYTDVKFIVAFNVSGDGDEIDVTDEITYRGNLNLFDAICQPRKGASYFFDEPWASGAAYDPPANFDPYLANNVRNRFDADDDPATPIPTQPTPDTDVLWAFDSGGYICPNDVMSLVHCQDFLAATPMFFDSIWRFDVGPNEKVLISEAAPVSVPEAGLVLASFVAAEDGFISGIYVQFNGSTDLTPDPDHDTDVTNRTYEIGWTIDGSPTFFTEILKDESEYLAEPGVPYSAGQTIELIIRSPAGQGTKSPDWTSISGYVLASLDVWSFDEGEADYPAGGPNPGPTPAPALLPAGTYCGLLGA